MTTGKLAFVLVAMLSLGLGLAMVQAQDEGTTALVEYRQRIMKGHGAAMGSIGDILKYKLDYGPAHIAKHAKNINEYSTLIPDAFKQEITAGKTDAKPEVWSNWDDFVAKANALNKASAELESAAGGGDMRALMPGVKALGDACRGCHNEYRKPEEERFPR